MPKTYTRLTEDERYQIYEGVTEKRSHREIALLLNKHHSTVSREVVRNTGLRGYRPKQAQEKANRRDENKPKYRQLTHDVESLIAKNIKSEWSPDQIKGRLKSKGLAMV
jgi:transposase, IS30 family